jgi:dihydroxyacetone kinase-like protein
MNLAPFPISKAFFIREFAGGLPGAVAYAALALSRNRAQVQNTPAKDGIMKKLINSVDTVVTDALRGIAAAHPSLRVDVENKVIFRAEGPRLGKVGLVSGGGSGHEPLHGGFVGYGMLDAACPGEVFTSPVPDQLIEATKGVDGGAGVLHIVKNYTGDVLNFEMAAELSGDEGVEVATVLVNDDVAVRDSLYTAGRRGTGATLFVEKIAGALAETGAPLAEVARIAREVNDRSRSFGVALTSCTVPAAGKPTFELGETEIELGIGIHGEPGRTRTTHREAREIARIAMDAINDDLPLSGEQLVMVNGMGGTPLLELYIVFAEVEAYLKEKGATVARSLVGNYVTSLDMQGFSVTTCALTGELTRLWDAPVQTPGLRWGR